MCKHDIELPQRALVSLVAPLPLPHREITLDECPFQSEIRGDYTPCWCCAECRHQCAMDI